VLAIDVKTTLRLKVYGRRGMEPKANVNDLYDVQAEELFIQHLIASPVIATELGDFLSDGLSGVRSDLAKAVFTVAGNQDPINDATMRIYGLSQEGRNLLQKLAAQGLPSITTKTLVDRIREVGARRELATKAAEIYAKAVEGKEKATDIIEIADIAASKAREISQGEATGGGYRSIQDMAALKAELTWRAANADTIKGYRFGFPRLEKLMDGLQAGKLYLVGARPSVGKTALAGNIITNLAEQGIGSVVFSLEMPDLEMRQRLLTSISGVNPSKDGGLVKADTDKLRSGLTKMVNWNVFIDDTDRLNIELLRSIARRAVVRDGVKVIIIDYIQLLRGVDPKSRNSEREEITEVSGKLKALAKELKVPVIALAQLKRTGNAFQSSSSMTETPRPTLESLKGSGSLEQDADAAIFLHRDIGLNASEAVAILAKNRSGATGESDLTFYNDITTFEEKTNPYPVA
jgi:replicative DNA helicase